MIDAMWNYRFMDLWICRDVEQIRCLNLRNILTYEMPD